MLGYWAAVFVAIVAVEVGSDPRESIGDALLTVGVWMSSILHSGKENSASILSRIGTTDHFCPMAFPLCSLRPSDWEP